MPVIDNTIAAECLGDLFKKLGKKGLNESRRWPEDLKNP